jgi:LemA protein
MKTGSIIAIAVGLALLLGGCEFVQQRNKLAQEREAIRGEWSQVDADLQRRSDLIPNLVETVKGFAKQEQAVFGAIAQARAQMAGARTPQEKIDANNQLSGALGRLLVVTENYPQLRSSEHFQTLMTELERSENRINIERRKYNEVVQKYNTDLQLFPKNIAAGLFGFQPEPYFKADEAAKVVPKVTF